MKKLIWVAATGLMLVMGSCSTPAADDNLYAEFQNPPAEARPRVWWHWMDAM